MTLRNRLWVFFTVFSRYSESLVRRYFKSCEYLRNLRPCSSSFYLKVIQCNDFINFNHEICPKYSRKHMKQLTYERKEKKDIHFLFEWKKKKIFIPFFISIHPVEVKNRIKVVTSTQAIYLRCLWKGQETGNRGKVFW